MLLEHCAPSPILHDGGHESEVRYEQNASAPVLLAHDQNKFNQLQRFLYNLATDIGVGAFSRARMARALNVN
jgi:hypothetical protein